MQCLDITFSMIGIFKTNVYTELAAEKLTQELRRHFPDGIISFDLEDCDKVLRVESADCDREKIIGTLNAYGFMVEELPE